MNLAAEISIALLGAISIIALSAFSGVLVRYFVGVGSFSVYTVLTYALMGDLNSSLWLGISLGICCSSVYPWLIQEDLYAAMLLLSIAIIGIVICVIGVSLFWNFSAPASPLDSTQDAYRDSLQAFKELERALSR